VYSTGAAVCYQNTYPGAYYQYGCGASTDGQSVATTYSGQNYDFQLAVIYTQLSLATSISPASTLSTSSAPSSTSTLTSSTSTSTSTSTSPSTSSPSSTSSSVNSSSASKSAPSSTTASSQLGAQSAPSSAANTIAATGQSSQGQTGIIAGSVVGGIGVIFAILALGCGLMRRRQKKRAEERLRSIANKEKSLSVR
jgi:cobalamin biosynthesis Mg chelatase CobN